MPQDKREYYLKNRDKLLSMSKTRYWADVQKKKEYDKKYYSINKGRINKESREYALAHPEQKLESSKRYYEDNKKAAFANQAKRRAAVLNQAPKWLTKQHREEMRNIYKNRPDGYHVDHIIPLKGKEVRGLHVPWNLQYLLASSNLKKGNR